jgi:predicted DCC family thiol-disulfide oxidoreductase YuxK
MTRPVEVLYDGDCGLCQRTVRIFRRLDILKQLTWIDFRRTRVNVDPGRLEHEMAAIVDGRTYFGFSAYRAMSWRLPIFWPLLPFLYVPGVRHIGDAIYRYVADNRDTSCLVPRDGK